MKIRGSTKLYGVAGYPVAHSLSPVMHNAWMADFDIDAAYTAFEIAPDRFEEALIGLSAAGVAGLNITAPFKERAAASAFSRSRSVERIAAANCLTLADGHYAAFNTDGNGLVLDLDTRAKGWREHRGSIVLLGAGGASRAILNALIETTNRPVYLVNRDQTRAKATASLAPNGRVEVMGWHDLADREAEFGLVINATSRGLNGKDAFTLPFHAFSKDCIVYDTVYAPRETVFLKTARQAGLLAIDGLGMLVGQGALAFENWFGIRPDPIIGLKRLEAETST